MNARAVFLAGPTGSGKTALALELARALDGEIINADSRQLYADFPIVTACPDATERAQAPHWLYGELAITAKSAAGAWAEKAAAQARAIVSRGRVPIFVGGTGLYFKAIGEGFASIPPVPEAIRKEIGLAIERQGSFAMREKLSLVDPVYARKIHPADKQRVWRALEVWAATGEAFSAWHRRSRPPLCSAPLLALNTALNELEPRLARRQDLMLERGAAVEAEKAMEKCADASAPGWSGIGCAELFAWLVGEIDFSECKRRWLANTRAYAKRQITWFRGRKNAIRIKPEADAALAAIARWQKEMKSA